jgi:hypothetical protein
MTCRAEKIAESRSNQSRQRQGVGPAENSGQKSVQVIEQKRYACCETLTNESKRFGRTKQLRICYLENPYWSNQECERMSKRPKDECQAADDLVIRALAFVIPPVIPLLVLLVSLK